LHGSPGPTLLGGLELGATGIPEARAHAEEVLTGGGTLYGRPQPEEGVVLHGALPQVLAGLLVVQPEDKRVLLLPALVVVFDYNECQFLFLEIQLADLGPKEQADLLISLEDEYASGREAKMVLAAVFSQHRVHVNTVHVQPLGLVQESGLSLGGRETSARLVLVQYGYLQVLRLFGHESELRDGGRRMLLVIVVAQLSCNRRRNQVRGSSI